MNDDQCQINSIIDRLIQNRQDPAQWMKTNVKTIDQAKGIIDFKIYQFQESILNIFLSKHFVITLKSRQVGMSTLSQAICLWSALHYSNFNVLIISATQRNASSFLRKLRMMYEYLPDNELKIPLKVDNKQSLVFENNSTIVAIPATRNSSLGESINILIIDEAAFIKRVKDVYQASYPTLSRSFKSAKGKPYGIIIISTPNGVSGEGKWYYDMYQGAINKDNKYVPVKIHWSQVPEYDNAWYLDQCKQLNWDYRSIAAELELSFVSSGNTFIPGAILDSINIEEPLQKSADNCLWVWKLPEPSKTYVMGVDVAYGDRKDFSTIQVLDAFTLEQVAEYENNTIKPDEFSAVIIQLAKMYNNALINVERNAVGKILITKLLTSTEGGIGLNLYRDISKNDLKNDKSKDPYKQNIGTDVNVSTRDILLANMYEIVLTHYSSAIDSAAIEDSTIDAQERFERMMGNKKANNIKISSIIKSERLLHQYLTFTVNEHGKIEGPKDDLIFAHMHSLYAWTKSKHKLLIKYDNIYKDTFGISTENNRKYKMIEALNNDSTFKFKSKMTVSELQEFLDDVEEKNNNNNSEINSSDSNSKVEKNSTLTDIYTSFYNMKSNKTKF